MCKIKSIQTVRFKVKNSWKQKHCKQNVTTTSSAYRYAVAHGKYQQYCCHAMTIASFMTVRCFSPIYLQASKAYTDSRKFFFIYLKQIRTIMMTLTFWNVLSIFSRVLKMKRLVTRWFLIFFWVVHWVMV